eukprot:560540-Prorocentrum_minimum.AAC.1
MSWARAWLAPSRPIEGRPPPAASSPARESALETALCAQCVRSPPGRLGGNPAAPRPGEKESASLNVSLSVPLCPSGAEPVDSNVGIASVIECISLRRGERGERGQPSGEG